MSAESVLFVDDDPSILSALRRVMLDEPFEVRTCENPVHALDEVKAQPPTVVVADFYMPPMNGPAFLHEVRRLAPHAVRMILTGKPDLAAVLAAVQEGAVYRFLLKPWDDDDLRMSVRQAFDHFHLVAERDRLFAELQHRRDAGS
ncbi:MAG TPA: response regulator [Planctomycetota bacterium]|nr:response regulator [Planctomycetota bacterium]